MLKNYLKIAMKGLVRHKYYSFVSLFGISITLIVLTISIAIINHTATLGKPGSKLDRCLIANRIEAIFKDGQIESFPSYRLLDHYFRNLKGAEAVSLFSNSKDIVIYTDNNRIPSTMMYTDDVFWNIVEFPFTEGMPYKKDDVDKARMLAVITDKAKQRIFGNRQAIGQYLETSTGTYRVVGVIPYREINANSLNAEIYSPITTSLSAMNNEQVWGDGNAFVLVPDKAQFASVKREFQDHAKQAYNDYQKELELQTMDIFLGTMKESISNQLHQNAMVYLAGIVAIMLLFMSFPAVNLMVINFSRIIERYPEIGIRKAFGASSTALMGQFILENIFLTLIGGIIALILSSLILTYINNAGFVPWGYIKMDLKVFLYSMVVTVFFGIFSGILPSYKMSRVHPAEALKGLSQ